MKIILYLFTLFILSCGAIESQAPNSTIEFNVGYNSQHKFTGSFFNKQNKEFILYFADPITYKWIKFYSLNNKIIDSINLRPVCKLLGNVDGIHIISMDTIVLNNSKNNQIAVLNSKGDILKFIELNKLKNPIEGLQYSSQLSFLPYLNNDTPLNSFVIGIDFRRDSLDIKKEIIPNGKLDRMKYYAKKYYEAPYLLQINNPFDSLPILDFKLNGFYKNITNNPHCIFGEPPFFKKVGGNYLVISWYSDAIFVYDEKFNFLKKITIQSDFCSFENKPMAIDSSIFTNGEEKNNNQIQNNSGLINVFYDDVSESYSVIVKHKFITEQKNAMDIFKPFSIITLNKDFKKIHESNYSDSTYLRCAGAIQVKNGLLIRHENQEKTMKYSFYSYSK
jgi:hypothetical protein